MRMYGFGDFQPCGYCFLASSSLTEPAMITSSPCFQFTGVATLCLAVSCSESITRNTSSKSRPVNELDLLVRADDEDVADRLVVRGRALGRVAGHGGGEHAVELRYVEVGIGDHRVIRGEALGLLDVVGPAVMAGERIDGQPDDLDAAPVEFGLDLGHVAELGRADRREVLGVRE